MGTVVSAQFSKCACTCAVSGVQKEVHRRIRKGPIVQNMLGNVRGTWGVDYNTFRIAHLVANKSVLLR